MFLAPIHTIASLAINVENVILYVIVSVVPVACLYTIPFWISISYLNKYAASSIRKYIVFDALTCLLPAVSGILISEIVNTIMNGESFADGFITVIFAIIFTMVTLIAWGIYYLLSRE